MQFSGKRGQMAGNLVGGMIAILVVVLVAVFVVFPQINSAIYGAQATQTNLSGGALAMMQQTPLLLVLAFIFLPIVGFAVASVRT